MHANILPKIEAALFINGEALSFSALGKILGVDQKELQEAIILYRQALEKRSDSGLALVEDGKSVRLVIKPDFKEVAENITKSELQELLSKAALEVLSMVAYLAPISRSEIDAIRGVNSSFTLRNLSLRGLIAREGNPEDARGYVYNPSMDFLMTLGIQSVNDLPNYQKLREDERLQVLHRKAGTTEETHEEA